VREREMKKIRGEKDDMVWARRIKKGKGEKKRTKKKRRKKKESESICSEGDSEEDEGRRLSDC
jgi:hypothetical protein